MTNVVQHHGEGGGKGTGDAHLEVAGHGGQLGADRRDMAERDADQRQADHGDTGQHQPFLGHRDAGDQAEYDQHQRHIHRAEGHEPGNDREQNVESAGKPADLVQHITPSWSFRSAVVRRCVSER